LFVRNCGPGLGPILSILGTLPTLTRPGAIPWGGPQGARQSWPWLLAAAFRVENSTTCQNHPESVRDNQGMPGMMEFYQQSFRAASPMQRYPRSLRVSVGSPISGIV